MGFKHVAEYLLYIEEFKFVCCFQKPNTFASKNVAATFKVEHYISFSYIFL